MKKTLSHLLKNKKAELEKITSTNYNPCEHYLRFLNAKAGKHNKAIKQLFKAKTDKEQKLFDLLRAPARLRVHRCALRRQLPPGAGRIERDELQWLSEKVQALLQMTDEMCREKIGSFGRWGDENMSDIASTRKSR